MFRQLNSVPSSSTPPILVEHPLEANATSIDCLKKIPEHELYRLVIDGCLHSAEFGWLGYANREHGSVDALYRALEVAFTNLNDTVSTSLIQKIHKACSSQTEKLAVGFFDLLPGNFREHDMGGYYFFNYEQKGRNNFLSEQGFFEFCDVFLKQHEQYGACLSEIEHDKPRTAHYNARLTPCQKNKEELWAIIQKDGALYYRAPKSQHLNYLIRLNCTKYNKEIYLAKTDDAKLRAIITFIKDLELIHAFSDFNGRTSLILLQRLLIQNNFLPVMLYDPNYIDGYSVDELMIEIKQGMQNTKQIIEDPTMLLFNFDSTKTNNEINQLLNNVKTYRALHSHACRSPELLSDLEMTPSYFAGALHASANQRYCLVSQPEFNPNGFRLKFSMMNGLYVRVKDDLYFVSSEHMEGIKISLNIEGLKAFDSKLKPMPSYRVLTNDDLKVVEDICQHKVRSETSLSHLYEAIQAMAEVDLTLNSEAANDSPRPF